MDAREVVERFYATHKEAAEQAGDAFLCVYFSRGHDEFRGVDVGMDAGDALIVVACLAERFDLSIDALQGFECFKKRGITGE
jgi:hypothetical protein